VKPRTAVRVAIPVAWCGGLILILAGWPLMPVLGVLACCTAAVAAVLRWGPGWLAGLKVTVQLRRSAGKAGTAVDRA
jgi:hypothetical protein